MGSNFLGDVSVGVPHRASPILSTAELMAREGVDLKKGMNFRDKGGLLSVFLVLEHEGIFQDEWDEDAEIYTFQGHDSTTVEGGKLRDQIAMYSDGRVTENGKFWKAANAFKDGMRDEPLQIQVYEKLDPGVWFDKGIFNLVDAAHVVKEDRKVYLFYLNPAGNREGSSESAEDFFERMLPAGEKARIWESAQGRCGVCENQTALHFGERAGEVTLLCEKHAGRARGLLG